MCNDISNENDAKVYVRNFLNEICGKNISLNEQLQNLKTFDFETIDGTEYGIYTNGDNHSDDSLIVRVIYYLLYNHKELKINFEDIGSGKKYAGDTINTLNRFLGEDLSKFNEKIINYKVNYNVENVIPQVNKFKKLYSTIGNFVLLPSLTTSTAQNFNKYRNSCYKDLFDKFIIMMKEIYDAKNKNLLKQWCEDQMNTGFKWGEIVEKNIDWFEKTDFDKFIEINYLEDYENLIFKDTSDLSDVDKYLDFINDYSKKANELISSRADKICKDLEEILKNQN